MRTRSRQAPPNTLPRNSLRRTRQARARARFEWPEGVRGGAAHGRAGRSRRAPGRDQGAQRTGGPRTRPCRGKPARCDASAAGEQPINTVRRPCLAYAWRRFSSPAWLVAAARRSATPNSTEHGRPSRTSIHRWSSRRKRASRCNARSKRCALRKPRAIARKTRKSSYHLAYIARQRASSRASARPEDALVQRTEAASTALNRRLIESRDKAVRISSARWSRQPPHRSEPRRARPPVLPATTGTRFERGTTVDRLRARRHRRCSASCGGRRARGQGIRCQGSGRYTAAEARRVVLDHSSDHEREKQAGVHADRAGAQRTARSQLGQAGEARTDALRLCQQLAFTPRAQSRRPRRRALRRPRSSPAQRRSGAKPATSAVDAPARSADSAVRSTESASAGKAASGGAGSNPATPSPTSAAPAAAPAARAAPAAGHRKQRHDCPQQGPISIAASSNHCAAARRIWREAIGSRLAAAFTSRDGENADRGQRARKLERECRDDRKHAVCGRCTGPTRVSGAFGRRYAEECCRAAQRGPRWHEGSIARLGRVLDRRPVHAGAPFLRPGSARSIDPIADYLRAHPQRVIRIDSFVAGSGRDVSRARANEVRRCPGAQRRVRNAHPDDGSERTSRWPPGITRGHHHLRRAGAADPALSPNGAANEKWDGAWPSLVCRTRWRTRSSSRRVCRGCERVQLDCRMTRTGA